MPQKRLPKHAEDRVRALYEKLDAKHGVVMEIVRHREIGRNTVMELEQAHRLRAQNPGQQRDAELEAKFDEQLNRARERVAQLNRRYTEIGLEQTQLIRFKEKVEAYVLSAGYMLPDDDDGLVRGRALPRGANETVIV